MTLSNGHTASVNALALSEANVLASGGDDAVICLWDPERQGLIGRLQAPDFADSPVAALAFSRLQPSHLFAAQGSRLLAWDTRNVRQPLLALRVADDEVNALAVLEEERRIATADDNGFISIYDSCTGKQVRALRKHENIASSVLFRPGRNWQVISGGMDCRLVVTDWKGRRGEAVNIFDICEILDLELCYPAGDVGVNPPLIHCLSATSDGQFVAAGLENGSVELFGAGSRHLQHSESLYGHAAGVSALLWLPGHLLLSGGSDFDCFLWNMADPESPGGSFSHSDKVNALCGRSSDHVFLADSGHAIHCCDLNISQLNSGDSDSSSS